MVPRGRLWPTVALTGLLAACASAPPPAPTRTELVEATIRRADAKLDAIAALPLELRTFSNTVEAIDDTIAEVFERTRMASFLSNVATEENDRASGREAEQRVGDWFLRLARHEGLYRSLSEWSATSPLLDEGEQRLLDVTLRDFRREGMDLDAADRARLAEVDQELGELGVLFRRNIADDRSALRATRAELEGCAADWIDGLERHGDALLVPAKDPGIRQVMTYCSVPTTRERMARVVGRRAAENVDVLERILELRHRKATLLGYAHAADYETEVRMAGSADAVRAFYAELVPKLRRKAQQDLDELREAKRTDTGDTDAELEAWDVRYYKSWLLRERYAVDTREVVEYFPLEGVQDGLFAITQDLYGLTYREITEEAKRRPTPERHLWHEDVRIFEVWDDESRELLGTFYLDLFPRPGKYGHAAQFPLVLRKEWSDGRVTRPRVALVCNFPRPTARRPSLLEHAEVVTFFHEFGHCLHSLLSEAPFASLSGTNVARDFVEAPSQMFENWVWDPAVLGRFARHYRTDDRLPDELLERMAAAKDLGSGLDAEGQVFLGMLDLAYHTDEDGIVDTTAVRDEVYRRTRSFDPIEGSVSQASFGHLVGYQAGYYGYLWSLVYASDMFSRFEHDPMNTDTARAFRREVLSRGGMRDELTMVRNFLGREPNADAFLRELGLD